MGLNYIDYKITLYKNYMNTLHPEDKITYLFRIN
jgi:hypothetical protein